MIKCCYVPCLFLCCLFSVFGDEKMKTAPNVLPPRTPSELIADRTDNKLLRGESINQERAGNTVYYVKTDAGSIFLRELNRVVYSVKRAILTQPTAPIKQGGYSLDSATDLFEMRRLKKLEATPSSYNDGFRIGRDANSNQVGSFDPLSLEGIECRRWWRAQIRARAEGVRRAFLKSGRKLDIIPIDLLTVEIWEDVPIPETEYIRLKRLYSAPDYGTKFLYEQPIPDVWSFLAGPSNAEDAPSSSSDSSSTGKSYL